VEGMGEGTGLPVSQWMRVVMSLDSPWPLYPFSPAQSSPVPSLAHADELFHVPSNLALIIPTHQTYFDSRN
jgi:hypothetical protein